MSQTATAVVEDLPGAGVGQNPGSDFAPLLRTVRARGLLDRRHGWYARAITVNALALAAVVTGVALTAPPGGRLPSPHCSPCSRPARPS